MDNSTEVQGAVQAQVVPAAYPVIGKNIAKAMSKAQVELIGTIKKDAINSHLHNKYATLSSILGVVLPVLAENGLFLTQQPEYDPELALVTVTTVFFHCESGEQVASSLPLPVPASATSQQVGSAITYGRRYPLLAMLGLAASDDDDDGAAASSSPGGYQQGARPARSQQQSRKPQSARQGQQQAPAQQAPAPSQVNVTEVMKEKIAKMTDLTELERAMKFVDGHAEISEANKKSLKGQLTAKIMCIKIAKMTDPNDLERATTFVEGHAEISEADKKDLKAQITARKNELYTGAGENAA